MKKIISFFILISLLSLIMGPIVEAGEQKKIAILDFDAGTTEYPNLGQGIAATLMMELTKNKAYQVVERKELRAALDEQGLGASGVIDVSMAAKMGNVMGLDYILMGTVTQAVVDRKQVGYATFAASGDRVVIEIIGRLIDAETGEIIFAAKGRGDKTAAGLRYDKFSWDEFSASAWGIAADEAVRDMVMKLNKLHPLIGYVVQVDGQKIYLDLGDRSGVEKGQRFILYREGEEIRHPINGKILSVKKVILGIIKIEEVEKDVSIGKMESGERSLIKADGVCKAIRKN